MKILIPVDGSQHSNAALAFVAARARYLGAGAAVDLLNVQLPVPPRAGRAVGAEVVRAWHTVEADKVLNPARATLQAAQLEPACFWRVGHPGVVIAQWAGKSRADLVIMGSHGHTALANVVLGSVAQAVLAASSVPLLVLRETEVPRRASLRVGIAVDGSEYGAAAAQFVAEHRAFFGPRPAVTLLHVHEPSVEDARFGAQALAGEGDAAPPTRTACEAAVAPLRPMFEGARLPVTVQPLIGRPGEEIVRYAKAARLDMLVLGSHGHGAFTSALLGSVAWRVAATCRIPMLIVRPPV